jgi:uncharacterized protein (UPF0303 family)
MELHNYCPEWLDILKVQEETLRVEKLSADECFKLGEIIVRICKEKYPKPAAIRIITGGQTTFSFLMEGTSTNNEWWMTKKLNTSRMTGVSSILSLVEVTEGVRPDEPEFDRVDDFALCGGCFPLRNAAGKLLGYALASGLPHWQDHQLIVDSLAEFLKKEIPVIEG